MSVWLHSTTRWKPKKEGLCVQGSAKSDFIITAAPSYPLYKVAIVLDLLFAPSDISQTLVIPPG